jgi:uncharacterized RDD family membrane protein YckC
MRKISLSGFILACLTMLWLAGTPAAPSSAVAAPATPATAPSSDAASSPLPHALLAHGDHDHFWIASVGAATGDTGTHEQTQLMVRGGYGDSWTPMPPISSRAVCLASNDGELFVVLSNGQCMIADDQEIRMAAGSPQGGAVIAAANDPDAFWAIVLLNGAATEPSSTQPENSAAATTQSTGQSAGQSVAPSIAPAITSAARKWMAYRLFEGKWIDAQNLPLEPADPLPPMSMTVADQLPVLAWQTPGGTILVSQLQHDHQWTRPLKVTTIKPGGAFKLLSNAGQPLLWVAAEAAAGAGVAPSTRPSAGTIYQGDHFSKVISLPLSASSPSISAAAVQTIAVAFERLRWLASADDRPPFEQAFELDGRPIGEMAPVANIAPDETPLQPFLVAALAIVLVATGAAMMQRKIPAPDAAPPARAPQPILAPLGERFGAGLVDFAPYVAAILLLHRLNPQVFTTPAGRPMVEKIMEMATLTYIAHTMIAELICGQSLGKMLLGLQVTSAGGQPAKPGAIVMRNLLRVIDVLMIFPLLMVVFSPLRQRVGDLAAGTIVIAREPEPEPQEQE